MQRSWLAEEYIPPRCARPCARVLGLHVRASSMLRCDRLHVTVPVCAVYIPVRLCNNTLAVSLAVRRAKQMPSLVDSCFRALYAARRPPAAAAPVQVVQQAVLLWHLRSALCWMCQLAFHVLHLPWCRCQCRHRPLSAALDPTRLPPPPPSPLPDYSPAKVLEAASSTKLTVSAWSNIDSLLCMLQLVDASSRG